MRNTEKTPQVKRLVRARARVPVRRLAPARPDRRLREAVPGVGCLALHRRQASVPITGQMVNILGFARWMVSVQLRPTEATTTNVNEGHIMCQSDYSQSRLGADLALGRRWQHPPERMRGGSCLTSLWGPIVIGAPDGTCTVISESTCSVYSLFPSLPPLLFLHYVTGPAS